MYVYETVFRPLRVIRRGSNRNGRVTIDYVVRNDMVSLLCLLRENDGVGREKCYRLFRRAWKYL